MTTRTIAWLVSGCGISAVCRSPKGIAYWTEQIIRKGGVPVVSKWAEEKITEEESHEQAD